MKSPCLAIHPSTQGGAVLAVSLMFLLIMTMVGLSGMQNTSLEEKMTGSMRDRALAFQAAESALRAAEASLAPSNSLPAFTAGGTNGFFSKTATNPPNLSSIWSTANAVQHLQDATLAHVTSSPAYVVEELPYTNSNSGAGNPGEAGTPVTAGSTQSWYRVTARGTGGTGDSVVMLQSIYRR